MRAEPESKNSSGEIEFEKAKIDTVEESSGPIEENESVQPEIEVLDEEIFDAEEISEEPEIIPITPEPEPLEIIEMKLEDNQASQALPS